LALEDTVELGAIEKGVTREVALHRGTTQVRNGIYPAFVEAWDREVERAGWGDMSSLAARAAHYPPLFDKVSKTQEGIDSSVSLVAFSASGVAVDGLVARRQADEYETCDWTELQWCAHAP